ncbi:amino acid ABC transporter substrate-binding protein [Ancylobacter dichloromethanicus]|uniref:Amino acid ABC transporter substrate-binding protein n=1 Tax=Ancylobacter dichloromethanicus TaxID=518825 RepID=A0A9W6JAW8_9HYPH|nr:amino acid ABC transporter substrate-binding protein [Ancylobacter dichloromethanicus]MBS7553569.1 amino acid ABC transporter substrate-binding protein [Ancylobacter dichloromethanicus]GLK72629.1 amino acid ABC transporter substrate-binding protein [Ancylobacter dichloromethanicus]
MNRIATALAAAGVLLTAGVAQADTLSDVKARGTLKCGVSQGLAGFSAKDDKGQWSGFDVDFCKAVAAAIFDDASKVEYVPLSAEARFPALQKGEVDLLSRNSTWTMQREADLDLLFAAVSYYDGQGFMVPTAKNVMGALELGGSKVCTQSGTTSVLNVQDYFRQNKMELELIQLPTVDEVVKAYADGKCDVLTTDVSQLYALRLKLATPADHVVLPDVISKEPLGPVVRQGDDNWLNVVKWSFYALVNAEELGISTGTLDQALKSDKPDVKRFVGSDGAYGEKLGLSKDWAVRIVGSVGNYGEVFERNVGAQSALGIPRGINQLWSAGGIQYAPPIR